jgi:hypothetical protein
MTISLKRATPKIIPILRGLQWRENEITNNKKAQSLLN